MMLFSKTSIIQSMLLSGWICLIGLSQSVMADNTHITVLQKQVILSYQEEVRFSQILNDANSQLQYEFYPLGSSLINPRKQPIVEMQKQFVLKQLAELNTPAANHLAEKVNSLHLVYHEKMSLDFIKVRTKHKLNPIVKGEYWLSLQKRPTDVTIFDSAQNKFKNISLNKSFDLRDYLEEFSLASEQPPYDSVWIIQADRSIYQVKDLQWKNTLYFLSPGAMVFIGLPNLPDDYRDLNANVAHLFAFRLEL
ncbi:capsule biosynthesis GfcC D2 domain-containing protein [Marinomonas shanghaiensis]|uniref:capsule biosynthesis GfcC D2 domain-containing protein n=1 Tax=Marinomonas shanghaiensis TaxID=2202418 RepID=UPI003A8E787C